MKIRLEALVVAAVTVVSVQGQDQACTTYNWPSVEDVTYYRDGLVLGVSGLGLSDSAPGRVFGMDLSLGKPPTKSVELKLLGVPADLGMQPHGMYLDPVADRLYIVSHNDTRREEMIVVFGVEHVTKPDKSTGYPNLRFKYALKDLVNANEKLFTTKEQIWHFNDVVAVDGKNEIYVTQLGPIYLLDVPKYVWRCTWGASGSPGIQSDGRLSMNCAHAHPRTSAVSGYNGITISGDSTKLWVNDILAAAIVEFDRKTDGSLTLVRTVNMPRVMDNIEYDRKTGDITLSAIGDFGIDPTYLTGYAGSLIWRCKDKAKHLYSDSVEVYQQDGAPYQVASSTVFNGLFMLGSPYQPGPKVCKINQMKKLTMKISEGAGPATSCLMITAVAKAPLGVELQARCDVDDLSLYHIGMSTGLAALNHYGVTLNFGFPAGSKLEKGDYLTVANDAKAFEMTYGLAPTYTFETLKGLADGVPVGLAMAGQLVDSYGHPDGSDAKMWSAVAKWVTRKQGAAPGGRTFKSTEWTESCCMHTVMFEYVHIAASCPRGYWTSGCGQPASKQTGSVICTGAGSANNQKYEDSKCTGKKPMPITKACPATAPCPRCKGCKLNGDCWQVCGKKAGLCSVCDSADGTPGACCMPGSKDDPIECRISEPQLFSGVKDKHTCALLPGDAHVADLIKGVIQRLDRLQGDVQDLKNA